MFLTLLKKKSSTLKNSLIPRFRGGFFRIPLSLISVFFLMLSWQSCTEPDAIGLDLIGDQAGLMITDTVSIATYFEKDDTIPTNLGYQNLLGMMHDPVFGKTRASILTQFRLPSNDFSLGEEPVLDSVVLSLGYNGIYYGNVETIQTIRVFELLDDIPDADTLYNNQPLAVEPRNIGQRLLRPAPTDSTLIDTTYFAPHFRMRLSDRIGQKILNANGTEYFENISNFLEYFKGIMVTVEDNFSEGGSIFNINMFSSYTYLAIYYHEASDTIPLSRNFRFYISDFTRRMTFVEHFEFQASHPVITEQLNNPGQGNDSLLFLKALGGLRTKISFPFIEELSALPSVYINQAKLIIPVDTNFVTDEFYAARNLILLQMSEEEEMVALSDYSIGTAYFGGALNEAKNQYEFNITQHLQEVIDGKLENADLVLLISGSAENAQRVVLRGPGRQENPMKLEIRYSQFN
jgi:hypothetical protein